MHRQQGRFLSVHVDAIKMGGEEAESGANVEKLKKHVDLEKRTQFLGSSLLGVHSTRM